MLTNQLINKYNEFIMKALNVNLDEDFRKAYLESAVGCANSLYEKGAISDDTLDDMKLEIQTILDKM